MLLYVVNHSAMLAIVANPRCYKCEVTSYYLIKPLEYFDPDLWDDIPLPFTGRVRTTHTKFRDQIRTKSGAPKSDGKLLDTSWVQVLFYRGVCDRSFFYALSQEKKTWNRRIPADGRCATPGWKHKPDPGAINSENGGKNIMRTRITLACTECKRRNYDTTKDKKTHPERMEIKKYCRFCRKHTVHRETK